MGQKVSFATVNWKDRPNKPANKSQAEWDAEGSSLFSGFPFPIFVGKKWTGDAVLEGQGVSFNTRLEITGLEDDYSTPEDESLTVTYSINSIDPAFWMAKLDNWMVPNMQKIKNKLREPGWEMFSAVDIFLLIRANLNSYESFEDGGMFDYPEFDFSGKNLQSGINTAKRYMISAKLGFLGPFSRESLTRLWWTYHRDSRAFQCRYKFSADTYSEFIARSSENSTYYTGEEKSESQYQSPGTFAQFNENHLIDRSETPVIVCDIDSPNDFYIRGLEKDFTSLRNFNFSFHATNGSTIQIPNNDNFGCQFAYSTSYMTHSPAGMGYFQNALYESRKTEPEKPMDTLREEPRYYSFDSVYSVKPNPFLNHELNTYFKCALGGRHPLYEAPIATEADRQIQTNHTEVDIPFQIRQGETVQVKILKTDSVSKEVSTSSCSFQVGDIYHGPLPSRINAPTITTELSPEFRVVKFLQYDDGKGNAIYNEDTGELLRDPVTGEEV
jgi:hypothetical protein